MWKRLGTQGTSRTDSCAPPHAILSIAGGTRDPACVTRDPASVTRDPACVTRDPACVTRDPACVTRDPASVTRDPACGSMMCGGLGVGLVGLRAAKSGTTPSKSYR